MGPLRALCRICALAVWSSIVLLSCLPYQVRRGWASTRKLSQYSRLWCKGVASIVGLRVTVRGALPPAAGALVVSNHVSYVDVITHGSILPVRHTPKAEIADWPVLGWYLGLSRPIWMYRGSKRKSQRALRAYVKTMKKGMCLVVYPEGTTTDGKSGILPFKSTAFEAAIIGDVPIVPVITKYKNARGRVDAGIPWYGDMTLLPHLWQVLQRPAIEAEVHFLKSVYPDGAPRKELAARVHRVMAREYAL